MRWNDEAYCKRQEDILLPNKKLFQYKEDETWWKNENGQHAPVMFNVAVKKGIGTYHESKKYHAPFKKRIMNDVDTK